MRLEKVQKGGLAEVTTWMEADEEEEVAERCHKTYLEAVHVTEDDGLLAVVEVYDTINAAFHCRRHRPL